MGHHDQSMITWYNTCQQNNGNVHKDQTGDCNQRAQLVTTLDTSITVFNTISKNGANIFGTYHPKIRNHISGISAQSYFYLVIYIYLCIHTQVTPSLFTMDSSSLHWTGIMTLTQDTVLRPSWEPGGLQPASVAA